MTALEIRGYFWHLAQAFAQSAATLAKFFTLLLQFLSEPRLCGTGLLRWNMWWLSGGAST